MLSLDLHYSLLVGNDYGKTHWISCKQQTLQQGIMIMENYVANHTSNNLPNQDLDIIIRQASQQLERVHIDDQISCWSYCNAKQVGLTIPFFKQHLFLWF